MKNYKILYHIGDSIGPKTIVKTGILLEEDSNIFIISKEGKNALDAICSPNLIKLNGLGTMIKFMNGSNTMFLAAYRLFFNIGTGFAITNYFGTTNIKKHFDSICIENR